MLQLKIIVVNTDGTRDHKYTPLKTGFVLVYPNASVTPFGDRTFERQSSEIQSEGVPVPANTVAVLYYPNGETGPIYILIDQEAYLINTDGKTVEVINKLKPAITPPPNETFTQYWMLQPGHSTWIKTTEAQYLALRNNASYQFKLTPLDVLDPKDYPILGLIMESWYRRLGTTGASWFRSSPDLYTLYGKDINYEFRTFRSDIDPNLVRV